AKAGTSVLANYEWDLTDKGAELLREHQIPEQFAAVVKSEHGQATSYYFAGDYNDVENVPTFYQMKGLAKLYRFLDRFSEGNFYWSMYVPITAGIIEEFVQMEKEREKTNSVDSDIRMNARVSDDHFEIWRDDKW